jgi:hypothetical protein
MGLSLEAQTVCGGVFARARLQPISAERLCSQGHVLCVDVGITLRLSLNRESVYNRD